MANKGDENILGEWDEKAEKNREEIEALSKSLKAEKQMKKAFLTLYKNIEPENERLKLEVTNLNKALSEYKTKLERHHYFPGIILGLILCLCTLYLSISNGSLGKGELGFCLLVFIVSINPNLSDSFIKGILAIVRKFFRQE